MLRAVGKRLGWVVWQPFARLLWYVYPEVVIVVNATPSLCVQVLALAAKPSVHRLHLRNLYASGRRYQLRLVTDGFHMTTTSKVMWHYRRRTSASAIMNARLTPLDDDTTRLNLRIHIRIFYLISAFFLPTFMTSIVVFMPWSPAVITGTVATLYGLGWLSHRYNASYEANEMVYFVQTVLEEYIQSDMAALPAPSPDVIFNRDDFAEAWAHFYSEHQQEIG